MQVEGESWTFTKDLRETTTLTEWTRELGKNGERKRFACTCPCCGVCLDAVWNKRRSGRPFLSTCWVSLPQHPNLMISSFCSPAVRGSWSFDWALFLSSLCSCCFGAPLQLVSLSSGLFTVVKSVQMHNLMYLCLEHGYFPCFSPSCSPSCSFSFHLYFYI